MAPLDIAQNDLKDSDPARAAELEAAIRTALAPHAEEVVCSLLLVGFPRNLLRVELRGLDWCENLPLLPKNVPAQTVGLMAESIVERRRAPRKPGN
jgi:hypothetical protein